MNWYIDIQQRECSIIVDTIINLCDEALGKIMPALFVRIQTKQVKTNILIIYHEEGKIEMLKWCMTV